MKTKSIVCAFLFQSGIVFAANPPTPSVWTGTTSSNWSDANWTPAVVPNAPGATATFNAPGSGGTTSVDVNMAETVGVLNFDYGTAYTISGASLLTLQAASGSAQINITNAIGTASHSISAPISLSSPLAITQGSTANFTLSGTIAATAQSVTLSSSAAGLLVFSGGAKTYTGGTTLSSGTLSMGGHTDNQLGTGTITIGSATLQFTNDAALTITETMVLTGTSNIDTSPSGAFTVSLSPSSGGISGAGTLEKVGTGTLILTTPNSYSGGTVISAGVLQISNDNQLGNASGPLTIGTATLSTTTGINSGRSGSFTGNTSIIATNGNVDTFTGTFNGSGGLTINGGGTVVFAPTAGANSYSGGTTLSGASLSGNTNGIQGAISVGGNTVTFSQTFNGTYNGSLSGGGTLVKSGSGAVTFSGDSHTFSGAANLTAGTLIVNGSLTGASLLTVSSGATLSGSGTVGPTTNNGTISPGDDSAAGTLSVNGTLTLNPSSTVQTTIAPLSSNVIAVHGTANLDGAFTVEPTPGFYGFSASYTVLTSTTRAGTFGLPTSTNSAFVPSLSYVGNNVLLTVTIEQPFALFPFSNQNTEAVGQNIDALSAAHQLSADLTSVVDTFIGQSNAVINRALDEMHPAPYSAFTEMQAEAGGQLISLFHRLPYLSCCCKDSNRLWVELFGNSLTMKHHGMQFGFQGNSGGVALGYDGEIKDNLILGFGGAWNRGWLTWSNHHGHGEVDGFYGGAYCDWQIDQFYLGASLLGGVDLYETDRHLAFTTIDRHAKANPFALDLMAQIQTAYLFGSPSAFFYPYANVDFLYLHTYKFAERGAGGLNLTVQERTDSTLRSEMGLGLQVQDTNRDQTMCLSPTVSIGWVNMCPIQREGYTALFEGATIPFTTHGWDVSWNLLNVNFGLALSFCHFTLALDYNVEISPDEETTLFNQHGNARLDWKW